MEMEVFESTAEKDRGERDIRAAEGKLNLFSKRVSDKHHELSTSSKESIAAFMHLNFYILDLKKVCFLSFTFFPQ